MTKSLFDRISLISLLLLICGLLPNAVWAQRQVVTAHESSTVFENAAQLYIYTTDSITVAQDTITRLLKDKGFVIDTVISSMVHTKVTRVPRLYDSQVATLAMATAYLGARADTTLNVLQGFCIEQAKAPSNRKVKMEGIRYQGRRHSYRKSAFRWLEAIAQAYPGGRLVYWGWDPGK